MPQDLPENNDDPVAMTASSRIVRALEDDILSQKIKPGMRLDEQVLAQRFDVSRTPVREALRFLASAGLVELRRNHGAEVKRLTITELIEMFQVMAELEGLCARLATRRMSKDERAEMHRTHELCAEACRSGTDDEFFEANNRFHEVIYHGAHNSFLEQETRKLVNRVNPYRRLTGVQLNRLENSVREHQVVVDAIDAGDAETAHMLMRQHVNFLAESAADVILMLDLGDDSLAATGPGPANRRGKLSA